MLPFVRRPITSRSGARPRMPFLGAVLACALVTALLAPACGGGGKTVRIVLISLDTLRYDSLGAAENGQGTMPLTKEWAATGRVFERYYAATSTTQPTHASLFTGLHPWQHGVSRNGLVLGDHHQTLAERLDDLGFETGAVVASFPVHRKFGFDQGFDEYVDTFDEQDFIKNWEEFSVDAGGFNSDGDRVVDAAVEMLDAASAKKQFFFFHFYDAHAPYGDSAGLEIAPTDEAILRSIANGNPADVLLQKAREAYDADVDYLDRALDRLFRRLQEDEDVETHVFVTSDHGESFGEGGSMGHGKRLTREQIHVPFFILSPRIEAGVSTTPVGTIDVTSTILALVGQTGERAGTSGGRNLFEAAEREDLRPVLGMRRTFAEPYQERRTDRSVAVVDGNAFFLVEGDAIYTGNREALLLGDLEDAPPVEAAKAESVKRLFDVFQRDLEGVSVEELLDPETQAILESIGYTR